MSFLNDENILTHKQFGFRKKHNTTQGVLSLTEKIKDCLDKNKVCAALFIDLKAAFDTINIPIMLSKLEHYGIRNNALKFFGSYLSNRHQYIKHGDIESTLLEIMCGVPQGSVLGPLLFIIYINDLPNCSNLIPNLFADHAAFLASANDTRTLVVDMNSEMISVHEWMIANKLTLNYSKTKVMLFSKKRKGQKSIEISINNHKIEMVKSFKYLGVIIDTELNWRAHIEALCTKISQATGAFLKLRRLVSTKTITMVYNSLVGSHLNYGILIWGTAKQLFLRKLQIAQNKLIRLMTFSDPMQNVDHHFTALKILKVNQIHNWEVAKFIYQVDNDLVPQVFINLLPKISHNYNTRSREKMKWRLPAPKTELGKSSIKFAGVKLWATLSASLKQSASLKTFSETYKAELLEK